MPTMIIRVVNAKFESTATGQFDTLDDAFNGAIRSGLDIATQEVETGAKSAIVQIAVDLVGRKDAARGAVSIATERFSAAS